MRDYLAGIDLPTVVAHSDYQEALAGSEVVVIGTPSATFAHGSRYGATAGSRKFRSHWPVRGERGYCYIFSPKLSTEENPGALRSGRISGSDLCREDSAGSSNSGNCCFQFRYDRPASKLEAKPLPLRLALSAVWGAVFRALRFR